MAHGQSSRPVRRVAWLMGCVLAAGATGCTGPEKESLDPATKQRLLGLTPPPGAKPSGNATVDQRFNRTTPIRLPDPQVAGTNPPAQPSGPPAAGGNLTAPTMPGGNPAVMSPQPAESFVRTSGVHPQPPAPVGLDAVPQPQPPPAQPLPSSGGLPVPGGAGFPPASGSPVPGSPAVPLSVLPAAPLPGGNFDLPPAGLPAVGGGQPIPPMPGQGALPPLPGFGDGPPVPPLVK